MIRVNIESPCRGHVPSYVPKILRRVLERTVRRRNHWYAIECMRDALSRGEAPYASHVLFDAAGVLQDHLPQDRELGLACGDAWASCADYHVFYCDYGMSAGMQRRWADCAQQGRQVMRRYLYRKEAPDAAKADA